MHGAREIARTPASTLRFAAQVIALRFVLAAVVYAELILVVWLLDWPEMLEQLGLLFGLMYAFNGLGYEFYALLIRSERTSLIILGCRIKVPSPYNVVETPHDIQKLDNGVNFSTTIMKTPTIRGLVN